ncbi:hypothetical protein JOL62DRAFT_560064 [Phyllosticta paracitricarpa]|uniref:Uncharacterized protein n=1 Tax=Phyllosticta paracitricarpa TaxID=2016321 RepID=A0ABR1MUK4_9PEZI
MLDKKGLKRILYIIKISREKNNSSSSTSKNLEYPINKRIGYYYITNPYYYLKNAISYRRINNIEDKEDSVLVVVVLRGLNYIKLYLLNNIYISTINKALLSIIALGELYFFKFKSVNILSIKLISNIYSRESLVSLVRVKKEEGKTYIDAYLLRIKYFKYTRILIAALLFSTFFRMLNTLYTSLFIEIRDNIGYTPLLYKVILRRTFYKFNLKGNTKLGESST